MADQTTIEGVTKAAAFIFGVSIEQITPTTNFVTELGGDSLDMVELAMEVEDAFNVQLSDDELLATTNVQELSDLVEKVKARA